MKKKAIAILLSVTMMMGILPAVEAVRQQRKMQEQKAARMIRRKQQQMRKQILMRRQQEVMRQTDIMEMISQSIRIW